MPDVDWITEAPIRVLSEFQIIAALKKMRLTMRGWDPVAVPDNPVMPYVPPAPGQSPQDVRAKQLLRKPPDIDASDWKRPRRTFQERWNDRISSTNSMLDNDFRDHHVVGYFVTGVPVALMALTGASTVYVADLVCHPGTENAGGIMIEYAVNYGCKIHNSPVVRLWALNEDARRAYLALGFTSDTGTGKAMTLRPATSPLWTQVSGVWHLAKYAQGQRYAA
ncbi:MAG: hypothetical protein U1E70_01935 [Acetobacteraceae bacterium]